MKSGEKVEKTDQRRKEKLLLFGRKFSRFYLAFGREQEKYCDVLVGKKEITIV